MGRIALTVPDLAPPTNIFATASRDMYYTLRSQLLEIFNRYESINSGNMVGNMVGQTQQNVTQPAQAINRNVASTGKRKVSASARRAIAKAQRARWAKVAAEKKTAAAAGGVTRTTTSRRRTVAHKKPAAMAATA